MSYKKYIAGIPNIAKLQLQAKAVSAIATYRYRRLLTSTPILTLEYLTSAMQT
ncbi:MULTISPECIES: hypothetical protein [Nostoc]|uniref:Uncharacterized protein n=2 Tax=Nostoc TaxID=1177 RepID=A0ABR8ILL8_9NOSO|nr:MULTISPECIES: hypothetical protein [Nostoc]MBD2564912.1 hypothetical protein [Nostoc linckia FACHB-391]MBD2651390.1 hypothetical protein [Nostoc foliaceum FACHB-393]